MRAMMFLGLMILVALVTEGWAGVTLPPADSATDASTLEELAKVKKIQRNMKRLFTTQIEDLEKQVKSLKDGENDSLQAMQSEFQTLMSQFESKMASVAASGSGSGGSSYVRWGRTSCPDSASQVYAGVVGGKSYSHVGGAANTLCLTKEPEYDNTTKPTYYGYLYGAEYEYIGDLHNHDVPCSVCLAPKVTTIMVPARITCPDGWTAQYSGHLVSGYYGRSANEYLCLDGSPEADVGGEGNKNGLLLYLVLTKCGSLPCPPYKENAVTTCVVCSK